MRKLIASMNITIDGFCDHTAGIPDEELHNHYTELLTNAGVILYGRITFELMKFWQPMIQNPSGKKSMDDFAKAIGGIPKIVFSHTWNQQDIGWESAELATRDFKEEVLELKKQPGKDILLGSPSLIVAGTNLNLIDEYQLCIHPVLIGKGLPLFKEIKEKAILKLTKTKTFGSGIVLHYYETTKNKS